MLFENETEFLDVRTFVDEQTWFEILKNEIEQSLLTIKQLSKLTYITSDPKKLCEVVKALRVARQNILQSTVIVKESV